jgi:hypothetical protein
MTMSPDETRTILDRARQVVSKADDLSTALHGGRDYEITEAARALAESYDRYAGPLTALGSSMGFDEAGLDPGARDQGVATALAGILFDLEMANLLAEAAQATGELEAARQGNELDAAAQELDDVVRAVEAPLGAGGTGRFGFDEAAPLGAAPSASLEEAKAAFLQTVDSLYDGLQQHTTEVLVAAFGEISHYDLTGASRQMSGVGALFEKLGGGALLQRAAEALRRALDSLQALAGPEALKEVEAWLDATLDALRKGEGPLQTALGACYKRESGRRTIAERLAAYSDSQGRLEEVQGLLGELHGQIGQAFALEKRIVGSLRKIIGLLRMVPAIGALAATLDLLAVGVYLVVIDVALLRGMDYADVTAIYRWADGIQVTATQAFPAAPSAMATP